MKKTTLILNIQSSTGNYCHVTFEDYKIGKLYTYVYINNFIGKNKKKNKESTFSRVAISLKLNTPPINHLTEFPTFSYCI